MTEKKLCETPDSGVMTAEEWLSAMVGVVQSPDELRQWMTDYAAYVSAIKEKDAFKWTSVEDRNPYDQGIETEVLGFNKNWIDPDFNPNGTRACFHTDHGWIIARWNDTQEEYITDTEDNGEGMVEYEPPTHWIAIHPPTFEDYKSKI